MRFFANHQNDKDFKISTFETASFIPIAERIGINELNTPLLAEIEINFLFDTSTALLRGIS